MKVFDTEPSNCKFASAAGPMILCAHETMSETSIVPSTYCDECQLKVLVELKAQPMRGLGDLIERVASKVGITKQRAQAVAAYVGVDDCGCDERQDALNSLFPFGESQGG